MARPKTLTSKLTKTLLRQLQQRKITNREAAEKLGVSEWYLSRTVAQLQEKVPGPVAEARKAAAKLAATRRQVRTMLAKKVLRRHMTLEEAAEQANCHPRTIQRYMDQYQ